MDEITDQRKLFDIGLHIQRYFVSPHTELQYRLYKAWENYENYEDGHNEWYQVEITDNLQRVYRGILDATRGIVYLDYNSIMSLVQERIDRAISTFNAGHWPYKGL